MWFIGLYLQNSLLSVLSENFIRDFFKRDRHEHPHLLLAARAEVAALAVAQRQNEREWSDQTVLWWSGWQSLCQRLARAEADTTGTRFHFTKRSRANAGVGPHARGHWEAHTLYHLCLFPLGRRAYGGFVQVCFKLVKQRHHIHFHPDASVTKSWTTCRRSASDVHPLFTTFAFFSPGKEGIQESIQRL